jgi:hypothetical protein
MRILNVKDLPKSVTTTKTMAEFGKAVGEKPYLLNEIFTLPGYENLTLLKLTQNVAGLMKKNLGEGDIQKIESFRFDWRIDAGPRIPETTISEDAGSFNFEGSASGVITTKDKMFSKGDIFELVDTGHQFRLSDNARTISNDKHLNPVVLLGTRRDRTISSSLLTVGKRIRFIAGGIVPEASDYGSYFTLPNRMERHANFISRFRVDGSRSGDYSYSERIYLERVKKKMDGSVDGTGEFYTWSGQKQDMMDKLMFSINSGLLFMQGAFDEDLIHLVREEDGRPIPIGQGIIPQIRAYGQFMGYNNLSETLIRKVISLIVERRPKKTGNEIVMLVNWRLYQQVQIILDALTKQRLTTQDSYLTRDDNKKAYVVGSTYCGYEFAGNKLFVMEDSTLTDRYPDKGYGIVFNTRVQTKDGKSRMNIQQYTINGFEMFDNSILGVGGESGHSSGAVSSAVHASQSVLMAYRGVAVYDPYSTLILEEN